MTKEIKKICVFASASNDLDEVYYKAAQELGTLIAEAGYGIVYGGSRRGLMYACAGAVQAKGGEVIGVMPEKMVEYGLDNINDCTEFHVTKGMRERKAKIDEISDAVIAVPGGFGTLEEVSEMIVQKQLGYNNKPIIILNTANFYDHLIKFFEDVIKNRFAPKGADEIYYIANTPKEAVDYIKTYNPGPAFVKYAMR